MHRFTAWGCGPPLKSATGGQKTKSDRQEWRSEVTKLPKAILNNTIGVGPKGTRLRDEPSKQDATLSAGR